VWLDKCYVYHFTGRPELLLHGLEQAAGKEGMPKDDMVQNIPERLAQSQDHMGGS